MATKDYKVKAPDGQMITVRGPAGASQSEVIAQAKRLYAQRQQPSAPAQSYGKRTDGSEKGMGYFGELQRPDGDFSTEISVGVDYGSGEKEIPTLVPTLTEEEKAYLLEGNDPTDEIMDKAIRHAIMREEQGLSPFAGPDDYQPDNSDPRQRYAREAIAVAESGGPSQEQNEMAAQRESALYDRMRSERTAGQIVKDMFTGNDRVTPESQSLGELDGLLQGASGLDSAKVTAALAVTPNNEEAAAILKQANPRLEFTTDAGGNLIGIDPETGAAAMVNKPGFSLLDALQAATGLLAFAPAGKLATATGGGIARQAAVLGAGSAATQAGIEAAQSASGGEFNQDDVLTAGALGAASPIIAGAIGAGVDAARRGVQALRSAPGGQAPIVQAAERANIPLMTSDIAPPTTPIGQLAQRAGERIPYAGTGGARATQQEARKAAIQQLGAQYPTPQPSQIISSLKAQTSRVKQAAAKRYEELVPKVDAIGKVEYAKTNQAIDDALKELDKAGVVSSREAVEELQQFRETLGAADQTYSTLKENRTALRDVVNSYDSQGRSQLPSRAKALLNRVYNSLSADMDDAARAALTPREFSRLKEANAIYASEAEKLTRSRLKNVLDKGELTPEVAENLIFSAKRSEVKSLYDSLDSSGRDAVRATIVQRAITKAGGLEDVSPDRFLNELKRLQTQTGVAFKGDQKKQLDGLREVLAATKRASQTGITNTGQEAFVPLTAAAAGSAIGSLGGTLAAGATAGAIARIYESPVVRNTLIRIGQAPKSEASKRLALQLARDLNAGAQSLRAQEPAE